MLPSFDQDDAPPATLAERVDDALIRLDSAREQPAAIAGAVFVAIVLACVAWWISRPVDRPMVDTLIPEITLGVTSAQAVEEGPLTVHVAGAVQMEGVFLLPPGSRVVDAIEAAGGATSKADLHLLNLAAVLRDGTQIRIPSVGEAPRVMETTVGPLGDAGEGEPGLVDINTASAAELQQLPGVGPTTAEAIVSYREDRGLFTAVEGLLDVPGIGPAKLAGLIGRASLR